MILRRIALHKLIVVGEDIRYSQRAAYQFSTVVVAY
jgi:hypothetical protein